MPDPTTIPTRTTRDGNGHRVYTGGDLLGRVEQVRTTGDTGKSCTRWRAQAAAMAFMVPGVAVGGVPHWLYRPGHADGDQWLPGAHLTKAEAVTALLGYLDTHHAPAVGHGPHPDVAPAPKRSR